MVPNPYRFIKLPLPSSLDSESPPPGRIPLLKTTTFTRSHVDLTGLSATLRSSKMSQWKLSENYQKIAEANREFYSQTADLYESTESCVTDSRLQRMLEIDLDRVLSVLAL